MPPKFINKIPGKTGTYTLNEADVPISPEGLGKRTRNSREKKTKTIHKAHSAGGRKSRKHKSRKHKSRKHRTRKY